MFLSTRFRLTLWYVAIVAIVSFSFSAIIYNSVISEIERSFKMAEVHLSSPSIFVPGRIVALKVLSDDFNEAKRVVTTRLLYINGIIIAASGIAAYLLAGKTLQPIEEALEEQKRFTADASHELKTPLTALRTELEVALRDKRLSLKDAKKLLASNLEEVMDLQNLSENLMKLNRYSQNVNGIKHERVNILDIVNDAAKKMSPMAKNKSIQLVKQVESLEIKADKQSLVELIVILTDNAIKYSQKKSTVTITSTHSRGKLTIEVRDQGVGIAKENLPHLFDRFYRADVSRNKTKTDGYGLGLAIAKEIVEKHRGNISVRSTVGNGSIFTVTIPA